MALKATKKVGGGLHVKESDKVFTEVLRAKTREVLFGLVVVARCIKAVVLQ